MNVEAARATKDPKAPKGPKPMGGAEEPSGVREPRSPARLHLGLMLALTFSTGIVDAVGYLGLDHVFTGNMTGNVVLLGMSATGARPAALSGLALALGGFLLGAVCAGRVLRSAGSGWTTRISILFVAAAALLVVCAAVTFALPAHGPITPWHRNGLTFVLAAAMGVQAAAARHLAVKDVTTVVVTSTITSIAADSWLGARRHQPWFRRGAAITLIGAGAVCGAGLLHVHLAAGIAASALITITVALWGHLRRPPGRKD